VTINAPARGLIPYARPRLSAAGINLDLEGGIMPYVARFDNSDITVRGEHPIADREAGRMEISPADDFPGVTAKFFEDDDLAVEINLTLHDTDNLIRGLLYALGRRAEQGGDGAGAARMVLSMLEMRPQLKAMSAAK
jgi:hypothetical protein